MSESRLQNPCETCGFNSELTSIQSALGDAKGEVEHYRNACIKISHEVEQTLGKVLGYPWYKDDLKNFPDATETDGVCVGEHVPQSIALEAAHRIAKLEALLKEIEEQEHKRGIDGYHMGYDVAIDVCAEIAKRRHVK